jgi:hypothetical protein
VEFSSICCTDYYFFSEKFQLYQHNPYYKPCEVEFGMMGDADIAEILLRGNININQCNKLMQTPLILAVEGRHTEVVKLLVEYKCDINICDGDGQTPLILAVEGRHTEVVKLLVEYKCDINICDGDGQTLLHRAFQKKFSYISITPPTSPVKWSLSISITDIYITFIFY